MRNGRHHGLGLKAILLRWILFPVMGLLLASPLSADVDVEIVGVPDYSWYAGCFGTATGNLFGYWDRSGMSNFYRGPTGAGLAPLNSGGANVGIRSMWASKAGFDGRPANKPGHIDDYWEYYFNDGSFSYESTIADAYVRLGRAEHTPDCVGDFIGLSQKKWVNQNGECDGNIDAYSFVYWDASGERRLNYTPTTQTGSPTVDIQSGLRSWAKYCGYEADVFTQMANFNPHTPAGKGFTIQDVKWEIDHGYPLLVFLQSYSVTSRSLSGMPKANPEIHGVLIYGYSEDEFGPLVRVRTSWASGDDLRTWQEWSSFPWLNLPGLSVRGVIGFHPRPAIVSVVRNPGTLTLNWHGPTSSVKNNLTGAIQPVHQYVVERSDILTPAKFFPITDPSTNLFATVPESPNGRGYYRVKLL